MVKWLTSGPSRLPMLEMLPLLKAEAKERQRQAGKDHIGNLINQESRVSIPGCEAETIDPRDIHRDKVLLTRQRITTEYVRLHVCYGVA